MPASNSEFAVTLNQAWAETERGNVLLTRRDNGDMNAWLRIQGNIRLEISWRTENYPALNVTCVNIDDDALFRHLINSFDSGWVVRKLNLQFDQTPGELIARWKTKEER